MYEQHNLTACTTARSPGAGLADRIVAAKDGRAEAPMDGFTAVLSASPAHGLRIEASEQLPSSSQNHHPNEQHNLKAYTTVRRAGAGAADRIVAAKDGRAEAPMDGFTAVLSAAPAPARRIEVEMKTHQMFDEHPAISASEQPPSSNAKHSAE